PHRDAIVPGLGHPHRDNGVAGVGGTVNVHALLAPLVAESDARSAGAEGRALPNTLHQIRRPTGRDRAGYAQCRAVGDAVAGAAHHHTIVPGIGHAHRANGVAGVGGTVDVHAVLAPLVA